MPRTNSLGDVLKERFLNDCEVLFQREKSENIQKALGGNRACVGPEGRLHEKEVGKAATKWKGKFLPEVPILRATVCLPETFFPGLSIA